MSAVKVGLPDARMALVGDSNAPTPVWRQFFEALWNRSGGYSDTIDSSATFIANLTSDNVPEGATHLYFTPARVREAITFSAPMALDVVTGIVTIALAAVATTGDYSDLAGTPPTQAGWSPDTGAADRGAHANYSGLASVLYTQVELQDVMDRLAILSQQVRALKADLTAYGAISA